jgi:hypothetical protein
LMKMNWTFWRKAEFSASPGSRSRQRSDAIRWGVYFLCDPSGDQEDFVHIGWGSDLMVNIAAKYCRGRRFSRSLDLCTGSGVRGICLSREAEEAICADINPRALAMVQANARLNKIRNVATIHSDLFSSIPGRFDCITANTPYVPHPEGAQLPIGGGYRHRIHHYPAAGTSGEIDR